MNKSLFILNLFLLISTLTLVIACNGSKNSSSSSSASRKTVTQPIEEPTKLPVSLIAEAKPFILGDELKTENIILNKDNDFGQILIHGEDAKVLYDHLQAHSKNKNTDTEIVHQKKGKDLACWATSSKINPQGLSYKCGFKINYVKGTVGFRTLFVMPNKKVEILAKDYFGDLIHLKSSSNKATLTLKGDSARALFSTLNGTVDEGQANRIIHKGKVITCTRNASPEMEIEDKAEYDCQLSFNYLNGQVL